ncbi:ATP-binding protein [Streptomyces pseudogriseolus]|uniref:ATP-binding protein n=1 Tax=Streptomyces pseudogriseolus TaxID=36817 RepID=UPI003FA1E23C
MARSKTERPTNGFTVVAAVEAVPPARRQVAALVKSLGFPMSDETLKTVELLASEVIANAVLHSAAPCDVAVTRTDGRLRVEVTDTNPSLPSVVEAGPSDVSGRGLLLVDALADAWGTQPEPWGKTTWFEITPDSSIDGLGNESADSPSSSATAVRRTDHEARMASSAESRAPFVSAPGGKRHQAA